MKSSSGDIPDNPEDRVQANNSHDSYKDVAEEGKGRVEGEEVDRGG